MEAINPENINTDPRRDTSTVQYMTVPGITYQDTLLTRMLVQLR